MKEIKIVQSIINQDCDSLSLYFKDIYKTSPLTAEEEIALAKEHSKESLNKLVTSNLRFVVTVAKQYQGQGVPLEDLISEGNIGLIKAAEKFDPDKGFKFISYAVWWIRQSIIAGIYSNGKTIKAPTSFIVLYNKLNKETAKFINKYNRNPSVEELAKIMDLEENKIIELQSRHNSTVSLDTPISEDNDTSTLVDVVENGYAESPDSEITSEINSDILKDIIKNLSEREQFVLTEHFGLFGAFPKSFDDIGRTIKITGERARQIKNGAVEKLRKRYGKELINLLNDC